MKKFATICFSLIVFLILPSCANINNPISEKTSVTSIAEEEKSQMSLHTPITRADNPAITRKYDRNDIVKEYCFSVLLQEMGQYLTLEELSNSYPVESVRETSDEMLYAVFNIEQGGNFYMFFEKSKNSPVEDAHYRFSAYIPKLYSKSDFSRLMRGKKLVNLPIDDLLSFYKEISEDEIFMFLLPLRDGTLAMSIDYSGKDSRIVGLSLIDETVFEYGKVISEALSWSGDTAWDIAWECRILEEDFPDE